MWALDPANLVLNTPPPVSWETHPALPAGMSISGGTISGTPSVYAKNQTYTIYANQSGYSTTHELYFSVDTDNAHTVVENQTIDPIGFHPPFNNGTTNWTVSPALPADLVMDPNTGEITGSVNGVLANTTYTVTATHGSSGSGGSGSTFVNNSGTVGPAWASSVTKIAVDSNGYKHITYGVGFSPYEVNYTTDVSGSWVTTPLLQNSDAGGYHDIVVDSNDKIHIVWRNYSSGSIIHLTNAGGSWVNTTVDSSVGNGRISMAIDSLDNLHISYYDSSPGYNGDLKYAHNTGGSWTTTFIDSTANKAGEYNSITIDSNDDYHISYSVNSGGNRDVYYKSTGVKENLNNGCGSVSSVAVDSRGERYVICQESSGGLVVSSCYDTAYNCNNYPSSWTTTNITNYSGTGVVAAFDSNDYLHLAYTHNKTVYHSTNASGSWVHSVIDVPLQGGHYHNVDMVFDSNDNVHISYNDFLLKTVHYMGIQAFGSGSGSGSSSGGSGSGGSTGTGATETFTFNLQSLADYDGDGLPNDLPGDYDAAEGPTPGLVADADDDGDGLSDDVETDTGYYTNETDTGTDPLNPDTDGDGICDGPLAVPGVCTAGPDPAPFGSLPTIVGVNNSALPPVNPYISGAAFTYEVSPDLPSALSIDASTGIISGTPDVTISNTTYTIFANLSNGESYNWTVTIEILEDTDGDGMPDSLPSDYDGNNDSIRPPPGLTEDLDDDNDGSTDLNESTDGTDSLNPDTDGDGFCDGINAVPGICFAGPDPFPLDPTLPVDTDGDGLPDDDSDWTGPPYADDDDDNDGYPDTSEENCGSDPLNASSLPDDMDGDGICDDSDDDIDGDGIDNANETEDSTTPPGTSPTNPDTDGDGVCDGPESPVTSNCIPGPDAFPLDPAGWEDTDGDGHPNELFPPSNSDPALTEDLDDDNDGWSDIDEVNCGSDPVNATDFPTDLNGDGICDSLDNDWDDDGIPNANETDTGVYNGSNDTGTDPWNPDTDGDGWCDGPVSVMNGSNTICAAGPDPFPHDPNLPIDTDGDGMPNELPDGYIGTLVEDDDDDNDNFLDEQEVECSTDPVNDTSFPNDMDGDGICDIIDTDIDGDGIANELELGAPESTDSLNPDTDGDGICDGPEMPANGGCAVGPDEFPLDPSAFRDTDGDGMPDELTGESTSEPALIEDLDDDNDTWSDEDEVACSSSPVDALDVPSDTDGDGICDLLDDTLDLPFTLEYPTEFIDLIVNQKMDPVLPYVNGSGEVATWEIVGALPDGLTFGISEARSDGLDGGIRGTPLNSTDPISITIWANNSNYQQSFNMSITVFADNDGDLIPDYIPESYAGNANLTSDDDDDNDGADDLEEIECGSDPLDPESTPTGDPASSCYVNELAPFFKIGWCCLLLLILLLILILISFIKSEKPEVIALPVGPEPENTDSHPVMWEGKGTEQEPFVLRSLEGVEPGSVHQSKEKITITNMTVPKIEMIDYNISSNNQRFKMQKKGEDPTLEFEIDKNGKLTFYMVFDDSENPSEEGTEYNASLKIGTASVYFNWKISIAGESDDSDKDLVELEKEVEDDSEEEAKVAALALAAKEKEEKEAKKKAEADAKRKANAEAKAAKEEEKARLKAEKESEKKAKQAAAAKKKAEADAKAAEEKAAKEADAKAKAEQEARKKADAEAQKTKEEAAAKKKAEADAKAAEEKAAKEAEDKKAAATAAKKAKKKPAAVKEAKKQEELQRVKQRAKSIDFKVLGEASSTELKSEVKKGATTLEVANAKDFAESGSAEINDAKGSTIIVWTGKDGNTLTGVSGVTRVFSAKAALIVKDDLQVIKGIGPFIEEKLNALGITTYRQLANMTSKLETQVNEAIEFFSGRVKRDQWVAQAKILLGEDVKLDEKALKQAEELERIAQKAEGIDFGILGVASASEANDLQRIKGIGPFIAEKLNALGIFKFSQLANMTSEIEEEVNIAIEFFPGRVKRDEWVKQAQNFLNEDK